MARKKDENVPAEQVEAVEHVTVNLDVDPNDPRKVATVDGNDQPVVDINVPVVEKKKK